MGANVVLGEPWQTKWSENMSEFGGKEGICVLESKFLRSQVYQSVLLALTHPSPVAVSNMTQH